MDSNNFQPNNISNKEVLDNNLDLIRETLDKRCTPALALFIQREMRSKYGDKWLRAINHDFSDHHIENGDLNWNDPQTVLKLMSDQWRHVFKQATNSSDPFGSLVSELRGVRNHVHHLEYDKFDDDSTFRALDSMSRLLHQAGVKSVAEEVERIKENFRREWNQRVETTTAESSSETKVLRTLIAEKTKDFVGRKFVFQAIKAFLDKNPNGYFAIEADPGVGKTAILAEYVRRQKCISHFNIRSQGINRAEQFLKSVCQQLIDRYKLPYATLPPEADRDGSFLAKLLQEASAMLGSEERLVIAIDALDEVDVADCLGGNVLYLPVTLPPKVYFVVTQRSMPLALNTTSLLHRFPLMQYVAESREDVRAFLQKRVQQSQSIQTWIEQQQHSVEDFISELVQRSENNFMYLRYVLGELERGTYRDSTLAGLPQGLESYYEDHWRRMGMTERSRPRHKVKIVYVLAEIHEPISRALIAEFAQEDPLTVQEVIDEWREFLRESQVEKQTCYSIYHASFSDFLDRKDIVQAAGDFLGQVKQVKRQIADELWDGLYGNK